MSWICHLSRRMFQSRKLTIFCFSVTTIKIFFLSISTILAANQQSLWLIKQSQNRPLHSTSILDTWPITSSAFQRVRRQIGSDAFRTIFKAPCFGRYGFFEDPFSCSHYHHCMLNGTHIRRTCMAPLQFSEERQMCGEPGTVDCPDLPDFWLAAGAAAAVAGHPPGQNPPVSTHHSNSNNAIVPASGSANNMAPFSSALPDQPSHPGSNNPFLSHPVTFNSAPQQHHSSSGGVSAQATHTVSSAWANPFGGRGQTPPDGILHSSANNIGGGGGPFTASRSSPADRDPFHSNDPASVITTHSNRRPVASRAAGSHHHPSAPLRSPPTDSNGQMHPISTGGHLQIHPNMPQPMWLEMNAAPPENFPLSRRFPGHQSSLYQVRQPGPAAAAPAPVQDPGYGMPSNIHDTSSAAGQQQPTSPNSFYTAMAGRNPLHEHMSGLLTTGPESPPDAVLDQMAINDAAAAASSSSAVQKVISNLIKAEAGLAPVLSAALQMQKEGNACAADQKGFFADQANHCRGYFFCSPFGDRAEFNCPPGRFFSEKSVSCENSIERSSCSSVVAGQSSHARGLESAPAVVTQDQVQQDPSSILSQSTSQQQMNTATANKPLILRSALPTYESQHMPMAGLDPDLLAHLRQPVSGPMMSWSGAVDPSNQTPFLTGGLHYPPIAHSMGSFGVFSPYHQPNAIQATAAKPVLIKQAPVSTESVTPVENPVEQSPTTPPTNPSEISLESHLRNAWNNVKPVEETLVETSSPPVITASDLTPTTNKGAKEASSSEEMLAMEARVIPMANSIGKAFDHARQMETVAAAGGAPPVKGYRPLKFVGSRRIIDTKLLAELIKS